jgi:hypothetical protein
MVFVGHEQYGLPYLHICKILSIFNIETYLQKNYLK